MHDPIHEITLERDQLRAELQRRDRRDQRRAADAAALVDEIRAARRHLIAVSDAAMRLALDLEP